MDKVELITQLCSLREQENLALDAFPNVFQVALLESDYVAALFGQIRVLLQHSFTEGELEDVTWFFYEWQPGFSVVVNGKEWVINNEVEFLEYFAAQHCQQ